MSSVSKNNVMSNGVGFPSEKSRGANTSLTPPSNRLPSVEFDKMVLSLAIDSSSSSFFENCKEVKAKLQATQLLQEELVTFESERGDYKISFNLQRTGIRFYPFVLKTGDITICLSDRDADSPMPPARLEFGSVTCQNDLDGSYRAIKKWLHSVGIKVLRDSVSRFDLCADIFNHVLNDDDGRATDLVNEDHFITRATNTYFYKSHRVFEGYGVGKSKVMMRVYDKIKELRKPENSEKYHFFKQKWEANPLDVLRVEFQLRRKAIKELVSESGTYADVMAKRHEVWRYLTNDWFRHAAKPVDRKNKHQDRAESSDFWKIVQSACVTGKKANRVVAEHKTKSMKQLLAQVRGIMTTICAGHGIDEYFHVLDFSANMVQNELAIAMEDTKKWQRIYRKRVVNTSLDYDHLIEIEKHSFFDPKKVEFIKGRQLELNFDF